MATGRLSAVYGSHICATSHQNLTMTAVQSFTATEFKARRLAIFDQLAGRKLTRVIVTKRGKVVAVLTPPDDPAAAGQGLHGFLRGSVITPPGLDLTAPSLGESLLADRGRIHG